MFLLDTSQLPDPNLKSLFKFHEQLAMVSEEALKVHAFMLQDATHLFEQSELENVLGEHKEKLMDLLQELINEQMVKLASSSGVLYYQAVSSDEARRMQALSPDEIMVYSYIQASAREGIWTKTIKIKSNLHQHVVMRCIKSLEAQRYIKAVKSVKYPSRKIYMLFNLQPSIEVTGGPWFTDSELDTEFIGQLLGVVWSFIARETFLDCLSGTGGPYYHLSGYDYPSVENVADFIGRSAVSTVELGTSDILSLLQVLIYDDKITQTPEGTYKATWNSVLAERGDLMSIPNVTARVN